MTFHLTLPFVSCQQREMHCKTSQFIATTPQRQNIYPTPVVYLAANHDSNAKADTLATNSHCDWQKESQMAKAPVQKGNAVPRPMLWTVCRKMDCRKTFLHMGEMPRQTHSQWLQLVWSDHYRISAHSCKNG